MIARVRYHTKPVRALRQPGFTLLEALVTLTLTGLLTASVALALRTGLDAAERTRQRGEAHDEARGALEQLTRDLSAAHLSAQNPERTSFHGESPDTARNGEPFLSFTALSFQEYLDPGAKPGKRSDAVRVEYSLEAGPDGIDSSRRLVRKERWLTETGPGDTAIISTRIAGLTLRYLTDRGAESTWDASPGQNQPVWAYYGDEPKSRPAARKLPRAVEVTLLLAPGSDDPSDKPRAYRTTIPVAEDGIVPFEPEVIPRPDAQPGASQNGGANTGGANLGAALPAGGVGP